MVYLIVLIPDLCLLTYFVFTFLSPVGKGLTSWLPCVLCLLVFLSHSHVVYLILSIPDLCLLTYFVFTFFVFRATLHGYTLLLLVVFPVSYALI